MSAQNILKQIIFMTEDTWSSLTQVGQCVPPTVRAITISFQTNSCNAFSKRAANYVAMSDKDILKS